MPHLSRGRLLRLVALTAVVALSAGATVVVARAIDDNSGERALPAMRDPIPVIAPLPTGAPPAASTAGNGGAADAVADLSQVASAEASSDVPVVDGGGARPATPRFTDPCAGSEPGAAHAGCGGSPGTILGSGHPQSIVAPLDIVSARSSNSPRAPILRRGCSRLESTHPSPYDLPLVIESNNPADFALSYGDPASPLTVRVSTSESERAVWREWDTASTTGAAFGNLVQTCALVVNAAPPAGRTWDLVIEGDDGRTVDTARVFLDGGSGARADRPADLITPRDASHIEVRVPMFLSRRVAAASDVSVAVRIADRTSGSCAGLEARRDDRVESEAYHRIAERELLTLSPTFSGWPNSYVATVGGFQEGVPERLCIFWLNGTREVNEREQREVTPPSRYRVRARVTEIAFRAAVEAGDPIAFSLLRPGSSAPLCVASIEGAHEAGSQTLPAPQPTCDLTDRGDDLGRALDLRARGPYGHSQTTRILLLRDPCDASGCAPLQSRDYRVTIPGRREIVGLCGGDTSCDPPTAEVAVGSALVRVDFVDGPSGSGPEWAFGSGEPFAPAVGAAGTAPGRPYLVDAHLESVDAGVLSRTVEVVVVTSTGSRVRAFVYDPAAPPGYPFEGIPAPCIQPGATGSATEAGTVGLRGETLRLRLDGLCPSWPYLVGLELTDLRSGARSYYGKRPADAPEGDVIGAPLWTITPGMHLNLRAELIVLSLPDSRDAHVQDARAEIGTTTSLGWRDLNRTSLCDASRTHAGVSFTETWGVDVGQEVPIVVHIQLPAADASCPASFRSEFTIRRTVPIDQLLAGVILESPATDAVRVRMTLTALSG